MRLFLDANVLFSAAYRPDSPADWLFRLAERDGCALVTSAFALEEAQRNIAFKRPERCDALSALTTTLRLCPAPARRAIRAASGHRLPEKDIPILAAAIATKADALVTGDRKHFGLLYGRSIDGVRVCTLAQALERLVA